MFYCSYFSVLFQFFFKATLLQQVNDLLATIRDNLNIAASIVEELEASIRPALRELDEIQEKIKNMEHIEEIAHEIENLNKKLAWVWVYDVDKKIGGQQEYLEKLKERIPACQERIDRNIVSDTLMGTVFSFFLEQSCPTYTIFFVI
jgi:structural maintenance of chromosomes protein 6